MIIWLSFLFPFQDKPQTYLKVENYINRFKSDSVDISTEKVGLGISRNIYGYYGFMTHHILEYDANNDNYSKGIIYKNWLVGHSINSWGNHSFMLGRLFVVKQKYLTSRIFAEFKFYIAVA